MPAATSNLDQWLDDPAVDIVVSATPPDVRTDHVCRAARAGKHVIIEKPIALVFIRYGESAMTWLPRTCFRLPASCCGGTLRS